MDTFSSCLYSHSIVNALNISHICRHTCRYAHIHSYVQIHNGYMQALMLHISKHTHQSTPDYRCIYVPIHSHTHVKIHKVVTLSLWKNSSPDQLKEGKSCCLSLCTFVCACVYLCVCIVCTCVCMYTCLCSSTWIWSGQRTTSGSHSLLPSCEFQEPSGYMAMPLLAEHIIKPRKIYFVSWFHGFASAALSSIESGPMIRQNTTETWWKKMFTFHGKEAKTEEGTGVWVWPSRHVLGIYFLQA